MNKSKFNSNSAQFYSPRDEADMVDEMIIVIK